MLTKNDIMNAQNGDFSSFFEAVKKTLEEKLDNNSFIKNSMSQIEYYKNLTNTLGSLGSISESECKDCDDDDDSDEDDDKDDELEDSEKDDDSDESDDDDDLDESLSYDKGRNYLIPLRETKGRRIRLKLVNKETYTGKLVDFDRDGVQLGWTWVEPDEYRIEGTFTPWKCIESIEFVKETGRRIF